MKRGGKKCEEGMRKGEGNEKEERQQERGKATS